MEFPAPHRAGRRSHLGQILLCIALAAVFATAAAGSAWATSYGAISWGDGEYGELGTGNTNNSHLPIPVSGLSGVTAVAAGGMHGLALLSNGTVKSWGLNATGQLGDGNIASTSSPVEVKGLSKKVIAISAGFDDSVALLEGGTVVDWGDDEFGELGNGKMGENVYSDVPVEVKGLTEVVAISSGGDHNLALLKNGTVKAWGFNEYGQLGNGSKTTADEPVEVKSLTGVKAIAGGGDFSVALLEAGTVKAWGDEEFGQLGNGVSGEGKEGEPKGSDTPVAVSSLTEVSAISAGGLHTLALLKAGTVKSWGAGDDGQLGNGATSMQTTPVAVSSLTGVSAIAAGYIHSLALVGTSVKAWGDNHSGELGNGSTTDSDVPVAVSSLSEVVGMDAGNEFNLTYGTPAPVVTKIEPSKGPESGGTSVKITGTNLTGATSVKFGSNSGTSVVVHSETEVTATSPAGTGVVDVTVTTPVTTSPTSTADRFTYRPASALQTNFKVNGVPAGLTRIPVLHLGEITLENQLLGKVKCLSAAGGSLWNETESGFQSGFENIEAFTTYHCSSEPACPGEYLTAEEPVYLREEENGKGEKVKTAERGGSGVPWYGELSGKTNAKEELEVKLALRGVKLTLIDPCEQAEVTFEGTLEPLVSNGKKNGLNPGHLTYEGKGGNTGHLISPLLRLESEAVALLYISGETKSVGEKVQLINAE